MGFMDKIKTTLAGNADKAGKAIDKAADLADTRTKGKHRDKIGGVANKAKDFVDKLDDKGPAAKDRTETLDDVTPATDDGPATEERGDRGPGLI